MQLNRFQFSLNETPPIASTNPQTNLIGALSALRRHQLSFSSQSQQWKLPSRKQCNVYTIPELQSAATKKTDTAARDAKTLHFSLPPLFRHRKTKTVKHGNRLRAKPIARDPLRGFFSGESAIDIPRATI